MPPLFIIQFKKVFSSVQADRVAIHKTSFKFTDEIKS